MFGLFKHYRNEITRLQGEIERKDTVILELLDRFIHHKAPARLAPVAPLTGTAPAQAFDATSDPLSAAEIEAERYIEAQTPRHLDDA
jgi:hypothetical protein